MKFRKAAAAVAALLALACVSAAALDDEMPAPTPSTPMLSRPFVKGDQTIGIDVFGQVPLFVFGGDATSTSPQMYVGGGLGFTYQYFLSPGLVVGAGLSGAYNETYGSRSLFLVPLTARIGYYVTFKAIELGLLFDPGVYLMSVTGETMFGPMAKAGFTLSYRVSNGWSVGLSTMYWLVGEIHTGDYSAKTRFGNFLQTGLFAAYHL